MNDKAWPGLFHSDGPEDLIGNIVVGHGFDVLAMDLNGDDVHAGPRLRRGRQRRLESRNTRFNFDWSRLIFDAVNQGRVDLDGVLVTTVAGLVGLVQNGGVVVMVVENNLAAVRCVAVVVDVVRLSGPVDRVVCVEAFVEEFFDAGPRRRRPLPDDDDTVALGLEVRREATERRAVDRASTPPETRRGR